MELEQPSPSPASSPSPAHSPTAPHRLIGPVVLLKDVLHPVLAAVREHHDHLVAVGTRDVGLRGRKAAREAGPGARVRGVGLDAARRAGPDPSPPPACFSGVRAAGLNGQGEGRCLLGSDVVAIAAPHLIAPFILILPPAWCLPGSSPLHPALLTSNNPEGQRLQQNLGYRTPGVRCPPPELQRQTRSSLHTKAPGVGQQPGSSELSHFPQHPRVHCAHPSPQPGPQLTFCSWSKAYSKPAL